MPDAQLFLAPCSSASPRQHYDDSVANSIARSVYADHVDQEFGGEVRIWGVPEGKRASWQNVDPGDYLLFYMGDLEYRSAARVLGTEQQFDLATEIWPDYEERTAGGDDSTDAYEYLIFLDRPIDIDIDSTEIAAYGGYDQNYPVSFQPLNETGHEAINEEHGSISEYLASHRRKAQVWLEKTRQANRPYKQEGELKLGSALIAPSRDESGAKRYETMREAQLGDVVLHLIQEQYQIVGVSTIASELQEDFEGPPDMRWTEEQQSAGGYLRWLTDYEGIEPHIHIYEDVLDNPEHEDTLQSVRENHRKIFYNRNMALNEGHYFTQCPSALVAIFASESPYLTEQLRDRGVEVEDTNGPTPEVYSSIAEATNDVRTRLQSQDRPVDDFRELLAESVVWEWTQAMRVSNLVAGEVTYENAIKTGQVLQLYREYAPRFQELADEIGARTIENSWLDEGQVLFVALIRLLQDAAGLNPNFNHVKMQQLLDGALDGAGGEELPEPSVEPKRREEIERQLEDALQIVFYGPPGTGKTFTARQFASWWLHETESDPTDTQLETVTFHPSFTYEDFVEGLTAEADDGNVEYRIEDGIFKRICERATREYRAAKDDDRPPSKYVLIVDEINRGNLSQIFGELITLLEPDKRLDADNEVRISLAHSRDSLIVPPNLYLIGTMNTADRSIALVDAALRRRFRFLAFPPDYQVLLDHNGFEDLEEVRRVAENSDDTFENLAALSILSVRVMNESILAAPDLGKGKQIGHSYLMNHETPDELVNAWKYEILPQLEEYFFGQFRRIQDELFEGGGDRLFQWEAEQIADFTTDDLRRGLAQLVELELTQPEAEAGTGTEGEVRYTLNLLLDEEILTPTDVLIFNESMLPAEADRPYDSDEDYWRAEVTGQRGQSNAIRWLSNDEEYSFSGLAQAILEDVSDWRGAVSGPDYWRHPDRDNRTLADLRSEVLEDESEPAESHE